MKREFICAVLLISIQFIQQGSLGGTILSRKRRGATEFYGVIQCLQPNAMVLKLYGDYGCFCGVGGRGKPLDETDRCCQLHDYCYTAAKKNATDGGWRFKLLGPMATPYSYNCSHGEVQCVRKENTDIGHGLCECDRLASKCFANARSTYDDRLANVDPGKWCSKKTNVSQLVSQLKSMSTTHLGSSASLDYENFTTSRPTTGIQRTSRPTTQDERIPIEDNLSLSKIPATTPQLPPVSLTTKEPGKSPVRLYRTVGLLLISLMISCLFYCLRFGPCKVFKINKNKCRKSISIPPLNLPNRVIYKNSVQHDHFERDHRKLAIIWEKS